MEPRRKGVWGVRKAGIVAVLVAQEKSSSMKQGRPYPRQTWTRGLSNAWKGGEEAEPQRKTVRARHGERVHSRGNHRWRRLHVI